MKDSKTVTFEFHVMGREIFSFVDGVAVDRARWDDEIEEVFVFVRDADGNETRVTLWRK